jgi:hypothetical protein
MGAFLYSVMDEIWTHSIQGALICFQLALAPVWNANHDIPLLQYAQNNGIKPDTTAKK